MARCRHDRGKNLGREGVRVRPGNGLTRHSRIAMASKTSTAPKRRKPKPSPPTYSLAMVVTQNLANMATVIATSGSVLLVLLIAKRF
jgi:hypothetical protein